jgi:hypothetical protein
LEYQISLHTSSSPDAARPTGCLLRFTRMNS